MNTCLFGNSLHIDVQDGKKLQIRDVSQFALGRIYTAVLREHPRRTQKPEEADLFFIPSFFTSFPHRDHCPDASSLVERLPHLTLETAKRHFWISPRIAHSLDVCEVFNARGASSAEKLLAL